MTASLDQDLQRALADAPPAPTHSPALGLPAVLPVDHLSHSSISLLRRCPEKWRRRYLAREYEPPSGNLIVGSASGNAETVNYRQKIQTGVDLPKEDVLDAYADEWRQRVADTEDIDWGYQKPERVRTAGERALVVYHEEIAPTTHPVSVERQFTLRFGDGIDWVFIGYLDLEERDDVVGDTKSKAKRLSQIDADRDLQAGTYLLARRAEGQPANEFRFHTMIRAAKPAAEIVRTIRTDAQLDNVLRRITAAAAEIHWRAEHDVWDGAPAGAWWCAEHWCGYWARCPFGGLR